MKPQGLDVNLWMDLSPCRPLEYLQQPAVRFTQAMADQMAYNNAIAAVRAEADAEGVTVQKARAEVARENRHA